MAKTFYFSTINLILTSYIEKCTFLQVVILQNTDATMGKSKKKKYKKQHNIVTRQWKMSARNT